MPLQMIIIGILVFIVIVMLLSSGKNTSDKIPPEQEDDSGLTEFPYESQKSLVTEREKDFYKILSSTAVKYGLIIIPKVRLADVIKVKSGTEKSYSYFNKIKAKHIDFIICTENLDILAAIELDDKSHDTKSRQQRDEFVNKALEAAKVKIIHFRDFTKEAIENEISELNPKLCPKCNSMLVIRENKRMRNYFWGCNTYPKCNYTEDI